MRRCRWRPSDFCLGYTEALPALSLLLAHGASVDVHDELGDTPLSIACYVDVDGEAVMELLRRSSVETRRWTTTGEGGRSAIDFLIDSYYESARSWKLDVMGELLRSGVPFQVGTWGDTDLVQVAGEVMRAQQLDLDIFRSGCLLWDWQGRARRCCTWRCRCKRRASWRTRCA